jgi:putative C-S lyase
MDYSFDEKINRFETPAAKFHKEYLMDIFGTDDLYPFWIADEDFKTPPEILSAFTEKISSGVFGYEYKPDSFNSTLVNWFDTRYGCLLNPDWVQYTPTIMSSIAMALDLFTEKGDGIIIQPPVYMQFENTINITERTVIENPLILEDLHYEINFNELEQLATKKNTKALMICNPHNPGGRVWNMKELQQIVTICKKHNLLILSDEIHADIIFSKGKFNSLLAFPEIHEQLVVCYSPAKVFNIASITDSMAIIPNEKLRNSFSKLKARYNMGRTYAFSRIAMETGFRESGKWVDALNIYLEQNVTYISNFLNENIPEIKLIKQEGTYLVWLKVSELPLEGTTLIQFLAKHAKMGVNDGANFGKSAKGFIRMNISCPKKIIEEAMNNLLFAVQKMKSKFC